MKSYLQKILKPWGYELILTAPESPVTGKILHLNAGSRFSLQYHEKKVETLVLSKGSAKIYSGEKENDLNISEMELMKGYLITPGIIHRIEAITDIDILEFSTKEEGTTVRLEDDYKRESETEENRKTRSEKGVYLG